MAEARPSRVIAGEETLAPSSCSQIEPKGHSPDQKWSRNSFPFDSSLRENTNL